MGISDKLPLLNSKSKPVRIVGYVIYALVALMILGALSGPASDTTVQGGDNNDTSPAKEEKEVCIDDTAFSIQSEDVLMQTGYFKKVNMMAWENDKIKLEVEPSSLGYSDVEMFEPLVFAAVERAPTCLGIKNAEITVHLSEYDMVISYPFEDALNHSERAGRDWIIRQK